MIIRGPGSEKPNALFNLIKHEPDIDKIHLYAKDPIGAKHQLIINNNKKRKYTLLLIQKLLSNNKMIWKIFIKIWKNTIQIKNEKY